MAIKNDAKLEEELTCRFKTDMRNLRNIDLSPQKPQKFNELFLIKVYNAWAKSYRGVIFDDTEDYCKIWRKTVKFSFTDWKIAISF